MVAPAIELPMKSSTLPTDGAGAGGCPPLLLLLLAGDARPAAVAADDDDGMCDASGTAEKARAEPLPMRCVDAAPPAARSVVAAAMQRVGAPAAATKESSAGQAAAPKHLDANSTCINVRFGTRGLDQLQEAFR